MPTNSPVRQRGTDTSGRPLYMSDKLYEVNQQIEADPRLAGFIQKMPVVQGSWMSKVPGGGAKDSVGFHDRGGCLDRRTRDVTVAQLDLFIYVASEYGMHYWRRDQSPQHGGMDPHCHGVFGDDDDLAPGALNQWTAVLAHYNGLGHLGRGGPDYERRPHPLPTKPPKKENPDMTPSESKLLASAATDLKQVKTTLKAQGESLEELSAAVKAVAESVLQGRRVANDRFRALSANVVKVVAAGKDQGKTVAEIQADVDSLVAKAEKDGA
jgi:hypothetical protein